jgi:hypothetical protein
MDVGLGLRLVAGPRLSIDPRSASFSSATGDLEVRQSGSS